MRFVKNGIIKKCDVMMNPDHDCAMELYMDLCVGKGNIASLSMDINELNDIGVDPIKKILVLTNEIRLSSIKNAPIQVVIEGDDKDSMCGAIVVGVADFLADVNFNDNYFEENSLIPRDYFIKEHN